jgi:hypothetical protein
MPNGPAIWPLPERVFFNSGRVLIIPKGGGRYLKPKDAGVGSLAETVMGNPRAHKMRLYLEEQHGIIFVH